MDREASSRNDLAEQRLSGRLTVGSDHFKADGSGAGKH